MRTVKRSRCRSLAAVILITVSGFLLGQVALSGTPSPQSELWRQVEVIRTAHGVPHIRAENLRAAFYALGWLQSEDYGVRAADNLLEARCQMAVIFGRDWLDDDFSCRPARARAVQTYHLLEQQTRDSYEGFAAGVNRYVVLHRSEFPAHIPSDFTGYDVATLHTRSVSTPNKRAFIARLTAAKPPDDNGGSSGNEPYRPAMDGSNGWAFAPSRTTSGRAILLRNPHLPWGAGYYEAHMTVPGVLDFYGDFRVGSTFDLIGGFNRNLGWAVTATSTDLDEIYAVDADPTTPDHYLFDGASLPLAHELLTVQFKNGDALGSESREFWSTPLGPVIHRAGGKIYIVKTAGDGEFRVGEQFLRMMRASTLAEWKDAMKLRAKMINNYIYADRTGNIYYLWNATLPVLPHPSGGDSIAIPAHTTRDVWTRYVPFDSLSQVLNPPGGYIHNENDSPHFTNLRGRSDTTNAYPNFQQPSLSLRSQLAIALIGGDNKVSLEDVVRLKHSYRMLLAERVKADLVAAVRATRPAGEIASALAGIEQWNNTAAPDSRAATLFEAWWERYALRIAGPAPARFPDSLLFATRWSAALPTTTPRGLADPDRAAAAFAWAVEETTRRYGSWNVAWGEAHRVRLGNQDLPTGGCVWDLGCFRVLAYARAPNRMLPAYSGPADGKLAAYHGDGWVLAVEFGDVPRAYSVLAYGESSKPGSPWYASQAGIFAKGEMKKVAFTPQDVEAGALTRFRPGEKP